MSPFSFTPEEELDLEFSALSIDKPNVFYGYLNQDPAKLGYLIERPTTPFLSSSPPPSICNNNEDGKNGLSPFFLDGFTINLNC